jgi:hypothetical protein
MATPNSFAKKHPKGNVATGQGVKKLKVLDAAISCFNAALKEEGTTFEAISQDPKCCAGELLLPYLKTFADHLVTTHDKLKDKTYKTSTALSYFDNIKNNLVEAGSKEKLEFAATQSQIKELRNNIEKFLSREDGVALSGKTSSVDEMKSYALWLRSQPGPSQMEYLPSSDTCELVIRKLTYDIKTMVEGLLGRNVPYNIRHLQKYAMALIIPLTYYAVGRGGEPRFISYNKSHYCSTTECFMTRWFMPKQLASMLATFCAHCEGTFSLSIPFLFAVYWMMGKGLERPQHAHKLYKKDAPVGSESYIFQELITLQPDNVCNKLTACIQTFAPSPDKTKYTSKSLRVAAITTMHMSGKLSTEEKHARSGHVCTTNQKHYIHTPISLQLPAMRVLNEWPPEFHCNPSLECLPQEDLLSYAQKWMKKIYSPIQVIQFLPPKPGFPHYGGLKPWMDVCTASLLMEFVPVNDFYKAKGGSDIIEAMINAGIEVWGWDTHQTFNKLVEWSNIIREDFQTRKRALSPYDSSKMDIASKLHEIQVDQARDSAALQAQMSLMQREYKAMAQHNHAMVEHNHAMAQQLQVFSQIAENQQKLVLQLLESSTTTTSLAPKTNPTPTLEATRSPATVKRGQPSNLEGTPQAKVPRVTAKLSLSALKTPASGLLSLTCPTPGITVPPTNPVANTLTTMRLASQATSGGTIQPSAASVTVGDCIHDMYTHGVLKQLTNKTQLWNLLPKKIYIGKKERGSNLPKYVKAMMLVDCLLDEEQRKFLSSCDKNRVDDMHILRQKIDNSVKLAVSYFKGEKIVNPRSGATYCGIGNDMGKKQSTFLRMLGAWKKPWWRKDDMAPIKQMKSPDIPWDIKPVVHPGWDSPKDKESLADYVTRCVSIPGQAKST